MGVLTHYTPLFGLANHDSALWAVVLVIRSTIPWHLCTVMSFPQPNIHDPSDTHTYYMLPGVFTYPQWTLQWTSHSRSCNFPLIHSREVLLDGHGWPPNHYSLLTSSYLHFHWKLAYMGWGWHICPVDGRHLYTRECQPLTWWVKKPVSVEDAWLSILVYPCIEEDICCNLMHHCTYLIFPPIPNLPLSLEGISLH